MNLAIAILQSVTTPVGILETFPAAPLGTPGDTQALPDEGLCPHDTSSGDPRECGHKIIRFSHSMNIIQTDRDRSSLNIQKEIHHNGMQIDTPLRALQVGKLNSDESVMPEARNVVEIYARADDIKLQNSRNGSDILTRNLKPSGKRATEDDLVVALMEYTETSAISLEDAKELVKHQTNNGDILVVPLQKDLTKAADDGDGLEADPVATYLKNVETYLQAVQALDIGKPILGTIPSISAEVTERLFELYSSQRLEGYCVDFCRRTVTAKTQLTQVVEPLMWLLKDANELSSSLVYAVNLLNRDHSGNAETSPEHLFAFTVGFDIVGDVHASPNYEPDPEEVSHEIKLLDMDANSYRDVQPQALDEYIPPQSAFTPQELQQKIRADPDDRYRLRKPVNTELVTLYLDAIDRGDTELLEQLQESEAAIDTKLDSVTTTLEAIQS